MNKVKNLQEINNNKQSKYDEIIEYLSQDDGYWLKNDKWDLTEKFFVGNVIKSGRNYFRYIDYFKLKTLEKNSNGGRCFLNYLYLPMTDLPKRTQILSLFIQKKNK